MNSRKRRASGQRGRPSGPTFTVREGRLTAIRVMDVFVLGHLLCDLIGILVFRQNPPNGEVDPPGVVA